MKVWVENALALLTTEQAARWQTLIGEPFAGIDEGFPGPPR
jgi:hypothetical protein